MFFYTPIFTVGVVEDPRVVGDALSTRGAAPSGFTGALSTTTGTQMGFDTQVGSLLVGAAAGSSTSWLDLDGSAGSGTLSGAGGSLYGTGLVGRYYLQGVLAYSAHTNRSFRRLVVGDAQRIAGSTHDGAVFSAAFGAGRTLNRGGWSVNPSVCVRYARLGEEGFAESGAGGASLVVHDRLAQTLAAEVGVRLDRAYSLGRGSLIPEVSAAWGYDLGLTGQGLTAAFAGAPGETVSLPGGTAPRHRFTLGAGLGFVHPGGVSFSLRYNPQLVSDYRPDHVGWGAAMQFAFR